MCCGNKRSALRQTSTRLSVRASAPPVPPRVETPKRVMPAPSIPARGPANSMLLRYKDNSAIRVRGPVTGRLYDFSIVEPTQPVDPGDAAILTRSGVFFQA
jgi:hypothetical protein